MSAYRGRRGRKKKQNAVGDSEKRHPSNVTRKSPTNPNFSVGEPVYPTGVGDFYLYGQNVTKVRSDISKPIGPYNYLRIAADVILGDEKIVASKDNIVWQIDDNPYGYYEIIITTAAGLEVLQPDAIR